MNPVKANTARFLKTGNRKAFDFLYRTYERQFKRYALILCNHNIQDADDLLQITCLQMLQYNGKHKDPEAFYFKSYFCMCLRNMMVDLHRRKKRDMINRPITFEVDLTNVKGPGEYWEFNYSPLLYYIEKLLTPDQAKVMCMRMEGMKFCDIAKIMDINMNTVVGIFRYGRMKLAPYKEKILNSKQVFVEGVEVIPVAV